MGGMGLAMVGRVSLSIGVHTMRRFVSFIALSLSFGFSAAACDGTVGGGPTEVEAMATEVAAAPERMAACHAAYRDAAEALEAARAPAAACVEDADCTVVVAETRCTGELGLAVNAGDEEAFLGLVDRVDARTCATVDAACASAGEDDPGVATVACVAGRCELTVE